MKYHITITDNKTGEVYENKDCVCIIGAYSSEEISTEYYYLGGSAIPVVATAFTALKAVEHLCAHSPVVAGMLKEVIEKGGILKDE